jgi:hypothetical protein
MARYVTKAATIAAGAALSDVIDCSTGAPVFLHMPSDWTPARLTFQVSYDGTNFNDLFDSEAREISFNAVPGTSVRMDSMQWLPVTWLKVRSGPRDNPRAQESARAVNVTIDTAAAVI